MDIQGLDIQWRANKLNLRGALKKDELPQILKVSEKFSLDFSGCLYEEERFIVHGLKTVAVLRGKDERGQQVTFPVSCPFEVKYDVKLDTEFKTVGDLCEAKPVPRCVKMTGSVEGKEAQALAKDEKLKVLLTERNKDGPSFVHFRSERGNHLRLPVSFVGNFVACPLDSNTHTLEEIVTKELPQCIKFIDDKCPYKKLGTIHLDEGLTLEYVFATIKRKNKQFALIIPLSSNIKVNQGSAQNWQEIKEDLSVFAEVSKFSAHLSTFKLEDISMGMLEVYDSLPDKSAIGAQLSLKSQTSNEGDKEAEEQGKKEKKKSNSVEKKTAGVREKAMRRMSKAKMLVRKKQKYSKSEPEKEDGSQTEKEAEAKVSKTASTKASGHDSKKILADEKDKDSDQNGCQEKEIVKTVIKSQQTVSESPNVKGEETDLQYPASGEEANLYDDAEIPLCDDLESPTYDEPENSSGCERQSLAYIDICAENEQSDDQYELPEPTSCQAIDDTYESPILTHSTDTFPRLAKEKPEKGLFSKMWKKVKKGATLPNISASNFKKTHHHISESTFNAGSISPSSMSPPICGSPEVIPTFDDEDIYEEIGDNYVSSDLVKAVRSAHRFSFSTMPLPPRPTESGDSGFGDDDQNELDKLRATVPPELAGNYPLKSPSHKGGSLKFKRFCDVVKSSEAEISRWGLDEVEDVLKTLGLSKHISHFMDNQIDGTLLVDLDEAVFRDLGMDIFEARKLRKFVFGWRPECMKTKTQLALRKVTSEDPTDWGEQAVVDRMKSLNFSEFSNFCQKNQVDGDLLIDIVADDNVLNFAFKGGKLNTVKLKKYIIDGWRPQTKIYDTRDGSGSPKDNGQPATKKKHSVPEKQSSVPQKKTSLAEIKSSYSDQRGRCNSSPMPKPGTSVNTNRNSPSSQTSHLHGKFQHAKENYLKQAEKPDNKELADRKMVKESPLISNIKQQLMEKAGSGTN